MAVALSLMHRLGLPLQAAHVAMQALRGVLTLLLASLPGSCYTKPGINLSCTGTARFTSRVGFSTLEVCSKVVVYRCF